MSRSYVEVLRGKRTEIMSEIERLRKESSDLGARLTIKENQLKNIDDLLAIEAPSSTSPESTEKQGTSPNRTPTFTDHAYEVLARHGKPLYYRELVSRLSQQDVYVPGQDPGANLIAHLGRDARFIRTEGRGMYGLASWPSKVAKRAHARRRQTTKHAPRARKVASG